MIDSFHLSTRFYTVTFIVGFEVVMIVTLREMYNLPT